MVIAIDGPAGAGKSTVAKAVADDLGFSHLDTGGMYRIVALASLELGVSPLEAAQTVEIEPGPPLLMNGAAPGDKLRTPEVTARASDVAGDLAIRELLVRKQRDILQTGDWVAEGRDICQVVAPDAEVRVWLTASPEERARRRAAQSGQPFEAVLADQSVRDAADDGHGRSTLSAPEGAHVVDTTALSADQVIAQIRALANAAGASV
jgi:cytidylate kinase